MATESRHLCIELLQLCKLVTEEDLSQARLACKTHAVDLQFSVMNQTKIVTAASELGRNAIEHGAGGTLRIEKLDAEEREGLRLTFKDSGPGIADMQLAMTDGYSTGKGLGLGLTGAKRLMDDFEIVSAPDQGTTVIVTKWK